MVTRYFIAWLPMIGIAFLNASLRELVFTKRMGALHARQLSVVTLTVLVALYVILVFPCIRITGNGQAVAAGVTWMLLTICFEFGLGLLVGTPRNRMLEEYNIAAGQLWVFFLLVLLTLPWALYSLRN